MRKLVLAMAFSLFALPALAFHCPLDMGKIDAALAKNPSLSAQQLAEVKKLRAEGETLHKTGKHGEAVKVLGKALNILGVK